MAKPDFKKLMAEGGGLDDFAWPELCGDFSMRIAKDGTWFYQGTPIGRKALCQLFATTLKKDDEGQYWLVTPYERGLIEVEDAPFVAVEMQIENEGKDEQILKFRSNLDHWVSADNDHPLRFEIDEKDQQPSPYILMWDRLEAKINRPVFYQLIELALTQNLSSANSKKDEDLLTIRSSGIDFAIGSIK